MPSLSTKQTAAVVAKVTIRVDGRVLQRIETRAQIAKLTKELEDLDAAILADADERGGGFETDDYKVTAVDGSSSWIDKASLLGLGVKPTVIAKATKSKDYRYAKVTVKKTGKLAVMEVEDDGKGKRK